MLLIIADPFPGVKSNERLSEIINLNENVINNSSIGVRFELWKISMQRIVENPLLGSGLGGFNTSYKNDLPFKMKYPHNFILELLAELGITGLLLLLLIIYLGIIKPVRRIIFLYKQKRKDEVTYLFSLLILFLFSFWLAMFSKDVSTQVQLYLVLGIMATE